MKIKLLYFSGTGNSLKVARDLASEFEDADVISIPAAIKGGVDLSADKLGIIFPVYMWGMPLIVKRFIDQLEISDETYYFAVATFGGSQGGTIKQVEKAFKARGGELSSGFGVKMPGNYTPMYGAIAEEKQEKMFLVESGKIQEIAETIKEEKKSYFETGNILFNVIGTRILYNMMSSNIPKMAKDFWVDENCNSCGICEKVCPVDNIELIDGKPVWGDHCEQCLACLQWCPQEAIQLGKKTPGRKRYHHPDVKSEDLCGK
jgi:ferredoxin